MCRTESGAPRKSNRFDFWLAKRSVNAVNSAGHSVVARKAAGPHSILMSDDQLLLRDQLENTDDR